MSKIKKIIYVLLLLLVLVLATVMFISHRDNDEKEDNSVNKTEADNEIDKATYSKLLKESSDEAIKQKVKDYLASDKYYHIQEELEYEGKTYKSVQICNLETPEYAFISGEYRHYTHDMLYLYYANDEKIKMVFDDSLKGDDIIIDLSEEEMEVSDIIMYEIPSVKYPTKMKKISFYRDKEFGFMEEFCITALVCYNSAGDIEDIKTFQGATGLNIREDEKGGIIWEVYIAEQVDYCWNVMKYNNGEKGMEGEPYSKGSVYDIYVTDDQIDNIKFKYKSWDNYSLDTSSAYNEHYKRKMCVKNYNLSIWDIINCEELTVRLKECLDKGSFGISAKELIPLVKELYGKETIKHCTQCFDEPHYITKEGYIVYFGQRGMYYVKLTAEEYMDMKFKEREEYLDYHEKPLFVDGEINTELVKELETIK